MQHISSLFKQVDGTEFSIEFIEESGAIVKGERCACTSFHSKGSTMNIKLLNSGKIITVNRYTIISFNGEEAFL